MVISPHNYLTGSPTKRSNQMVKISNLNGTTKVDYMGGKQDSCVVDTVCCSLLILFLARVVADFFPLF
jgi:hypothetical protein